LGSTSTRSRENKCPNPTERKEPWVLAWGPGRGERAPREAFVLDGADMIQFKMEERQRRGETDPSALSFAEKRMAFEKPCQGCGCPAHQHRGLEDWLHAARDWTQKFQDSDGAWPSGVPPCARLPAAAAAWAPAAGAQHGVTNGQFDPKRDGRRSAASADPEALVSVICTSVERHHPSHPLLYECFVRQTYEPRELVVIDTGTRPSEFLLSRAKDIDDKTTYDV